MVKQIIEQYDVVVCGGGLVGFCAAVAAARHGAKTCLVQDRPVFGGNSSSEIRVTVHGATAFHAYARETGILSELLSEERARNHEPINENGWTNSVWDMTLYDLAVRTPNLTFHLNTSLFAIQKTGRTLTAVIGRVANAETEITLNGKVFIDCTGDGIIADLAGCEWRMGTEGRAEFNEPHAPEQANSDVMGNSIHFKAKDMGYPAPFRAPEWAIKYDDARFFYEQGRDVTKTIRSGYWWLEIGVPWHTIYQGEDIRHELTRHTLGVWDWIKNKDPKLKERAANFALDWIGQVPGKRESRRILGRYFMPEQDLLNNTVFPDEIAFGGWYVDLHTPGGLLAPTSEPLNAVKLDPTTEYAVKTYVGPYGIPLRIMIAKDMDNLLMAGRNVSVTKATLGSIRVMATCALMGQAAGTAVATALQHHIAIADVPDQAITKVQQTLLRDGCFLPNSKNQDPLDLARAATVTASSQALLRGVGPHSPAYLGGMDHWRDHIVFPYSGKLDYRCGQWIALGASELNTLSVCLSNHSGQVQRVQARLLSVEHIWDYRIETAQTLAASVLQVPPGGPHWIEWLVHLNTRNGLEPGRYVRLDLLVNPNVEWHVAKAIEPGHVAAYEARPGRMRRFGGGVTLSFRVDPPQPCYAPENVLSGVTRPHRFTNLWRSDPSEPLPQWLQLEWREPQTIQQIELTFPGHLLREYHAYPPFYRDQQCARDYGIWVRENGDWHEVVRVAENYQRQRKHKLVNAITTTQLRIMVYATNGDPTAAIYEVRCYA